METLDLLKQQGNQAGPEILKAVQDGEITIELAEKAFENGNQCSPDILEALQENNGENIQKAFEQGNQAAPNIIDAYEAGEIGGGGDSKKVSISPYLMDEYNFSPTTDLCNNFYEYRSASVGQGDFTNSVKLCLITEKESYESVKLIANDEEYPGNIVEGMIANELTQETAEYLVTVNGEESREYFFRKIGQYYWQAEFPSVPLTENTDVTVVADGEESDSYNLKVNKPLKLTAGDADATFTITARYYINPPLLFVSTDGINWPYRQWGYNSQSESYSTEIQIPANTSVYLCGVENTYCELNKYITFNSAIQFGKIEMSGDLWTLVNKVGGNARILADNVFKNLFKNMLNLVKAPDINNINTRAGIYETMFSSVNTDFKTSDDGTNFNFAFAPQLPVTFSDNTYGTYREIANWMGNTNGFTTPK